MTTSEAELFRRRVLRGAALILGLTGAASCFTAPATFTFGLLCGGLLSLANFHLLYRQTSQALSPDRKSRAKFFMQSRYFARIGLNAIIIFALLTRTDVNVIGLLLGLSVTVLSIASQTLIAHIAVGGDS